VSLQSDAARPSGGVSLLAARAPAYVVPGVVDGK
jgi:hypothetical protein